MSQSERSKQKFVHRAELIKKFALHLLHKINIIQRFDFKNTKKTNQVRAESSCIWKNISIAKKREKGAIKNKMGLKRKMKKEKRIWKFYGENLRPKDLNNLKKIKT